jgi:choline transport protein
MEHGVVVPPDGETLALLGKMQVLRRRFTFWTLFAFAVCETVLAIFPSVEKKGGPAGLVYGFIIGLLSTLYVSSLSLSS